MMFFRAILSFFLTLILVTPILAQGPPPRIGPFVVDLHGTVPRFPSDQTLAASRDMQLSELPGRGLGVQIGAHVYPLRWHGVTFGLGGEFTSSRSRKTPAASPPATSTTPPTTPPLRAAEENLRSTAAQLSFNFGGINGWSYVSGGVGTSRWSVVPDGRSAFPTDSESLKTVNYGGGARWFSKAHLAFSFDVRFYAINPGSAYLDFPHPPRTTLLVIGAGVSIK
jgi:hypothetical protein